MKIKSAFYTGLGVLGILNISALATIPVLFAKYNKKPKTITITKEIVKEKIVKEEIKKFPIQYGYDGWEDKIIKIIYHYGQKRIDKYAGSLMLNPGFYIPDSVEKIKKDTFFGITIVLPNENVFTLEEFYSEAKPALFYLNETKRADFYKELFILVNKNSPIDKIKKFINTLKGDKNE